MGVPATAKHLGVTLRMVYKLIDTGSIPAFKVGRVIRIRTADVETFLESSRIEPGTLRHLHESGARLDDQTYG